MGGGRQLQPLGVSSGVRQKESETTKILQWLWSSRLRGGERFTPLLPRLDVPAGSSLFSTLDFFQTTRGRWTRRSGRKQPSRRACSSDVHMGLAGSLNASRSWSSGAVFDVAASVTPSGFCRVWSVPALFLSVMCFVDLTWCSFQLVVSCCPGNHFYLSCTARSHLVYCVHCVPLLLQGGVEAQEDFSIFHHHVRFFPNWRYVNYYSVYWGDEGILTSISTKVRLLWKTETTRKKI